jgi:hypothetical protein
MEKLSEIPKSRTLDDEWLEEDVVPEDEEGEW